MTRSTHRRLARRGWVQDESEVMADEIASTLGASTGSTFQLLDELVRRNRSIHHAECINLNPASNSMSPRARRMLGSELSPRTSLGHAGDKYEMGLEAIERIELVAAELAARLFDVDHVEFRVPSGAMANLYGFMATTSPGDAVIVPPPTIGGHVTHHSAGAAGLYGLEIHHAPVDADRYTIDVDALAALADRVRPKLITVGGSLNLTHHDVPGIRAVADRHDAVVLFDAAHLSGPIAGRRWPNPLASGAHLLTMSTYKSLAGPTAGLVMTNDAQLAEQLDRIAFPGMTANFDVGKTAALAVTLQEWLVEGRRHADTMIECATRLADELTKRDVPVHRCGGIATQSHAFAIDARSVGGGATAAENLRRSNLLASAIGLPSGVGDGVRIGTNELARIGVVPDDMAELGTLIADAWNGHDPASVAARSSEFRSRFGSIRFTGA